MPNSAPGGPPVAARLNQKKGKMTKQNSNKGKSNTKGKGGRGSAATTNE